VSVANDGLRPSVVASSKFDLELDPYCLPRVVLQQRAVVVLITW